MFWSICNLNPHLEWSKYPIQCFTSSTLVLTESIALYCITPHPHPTPNPLYSPDFVTFLFIRLTLFSAVGDWQHRVRRSLSSWNLWNNSCASDQKTFMQKVTNNEWHKSGFTFQFSSDTPEGGGRIWLLFTIVVLWFDWFFSSVSSPLSRETLFSAWWGGGTAEYITLRHI